MTLTPDQLRQEARAIRERAERQALVLEATADDLERLEAADRARSLRTSADMGTVDVRVLAMAKANQTSHGDHQFVAWLYSKKPPETVSGWAKDHGYPRGRVQQWVRRNKAPRDAALLIERESKGAVKADDWSDRSANETSR